MVGGIRFQKFSFSLRVLEQFPLPRFKGTTLRGGFGVQFKRTVCLNKSCDDCSLCSLKNVCSYSYVFETSPFEGSKKLRNIKDIPRPFVIDPPPGEENIFEPGDIINFQLVLIGKAIDYLPYFILVFKELGKIGLGRKYGRFELEKVEELLLNSDRESRNIYSGQDEILHRVGPPITYADISAADDMSFLKEITFHFLTPTRIQFDGKLIGDIEFHHIIRALLHRLSALSYFHCGEEMKVDYKGIIARAMSVRKKYSDLKWLDIERYSSRQKARMKLGGIIGKANFLGDLSEFMPLILLGEHVHIGKSCTFGLGKYRILEAIHE